VPDISVLVIRAAERSLEAMSHALEREESPRFHLTYVDTVEQAIEQLDRTRQDLIVLDYDQPGQRGMHYLRALQPYTRTAATVLVTALPAMEFAAEALGCGAQDVFPRNSTMPTRWRHAFLFAIERHLRLLSLVRQKRAACPLPPPPRTLIVNGYRLVRILGEGEDSTVFLGECDTPAPGMPAQLAVKMVKQPESFTAQERATWGARYAQEADLMRGLVHPHIVRLYASGRGEAEHGPYLLLEYVNGKRLSDCEADLGKLTYEAKAQLLLQIADALVCVHALGICHLDLKPHNILVTPARQLKLTDFSIGRRLAVRTTTAGPIHGSPAYMSPEAFGEPDVDQRADLFSLGIVAYEWLLNRRPFPARLLQRLESQIRRDLPPEPCRLDPAFPPVLQAILARLLRKDPRERYASAAQVVQDLRSFLAAGDPVVAGAGRGRGRHADWS